jgi:diguanylate cyclase (GGDEF)-like protein
MSCPNILVAASARKKKRTVGEDRVLSSDEGLDVKEKPYASGASPGPAAVDAAFRRARREAWLTRIAAVAVIVVLALWAVRADSISPAPARYGAGIVLSTFALSLAVLLAIRAGHSRVLAERSYLIELHQSTSRARHQVLRDQVSGLYSRWFFYERLGEEVARCARYGRVFSVVCVSFPAWKTLDLSTQGQVVERMAYLLQHELRYSDVAARWGPGRFVWYLPETDASQAAVAARRLAGAIKTAEAVAGTAQYPIDGSSAEDILRVAEARAEAAQATA